MGLVALAVCMFVLPSLWKGGSAEFPTASAAILLIVIGLYLTVIPFLLGLWQTLKLLRYIDTDQAFSALSVQALRSVKRCWTVIAALYVAFVPLLTPIAHADDAPGVLLFGAAFACAPAAVAVFAAVLQRLLQSALEMKAEYDLTV